MKKGLKIYIVTTSSLTLILMAVCTILLVKNYAITPSPAPGQPDFSQLIEPIEETLSDCIDKLDSCGAKLAYQNEPPTVNIAEAVVVYEESDGWYCYIKNEDRVLLVALPQSLAFGLDIQVGHRLFLAYDSIELMGPSSSEAYPMTFTKVFRVDLLGSAEEKEFQEAMEYYESKDWQKSA